MSNMIPMESNPDTMTKYLHKLGVSEKWNVVDIINLEKDALDWIPRPVLSVILLFPLSEAYEQHRQKEEIEIQKKSNQAPVDVFYLNQGLNNVCGTIALIHSVANNTHQIELDDGPLKSYLKDSEGLDSVAKGALLENSVAIIKAYKDIVPEGYDENNDSQELVSNYHFVTFTQKGGFLLELDGRKSRPINHGATDPENFLDDAAKICREFIDREPNNIGFNVVALVPVQ